MDYKLAALFGKGHSSEDSRAKEVMSEEIRKVGGLLHFNIQADAGGWHAECIEIDGLITGGKNPHPTDDEIQTNIREAIHTAFHITSAEQHGWHPNRDYFKHSCCGASVSIKKPC